MAKVEFSKGNIPTREELGRIIAEMKGKSTALDDLLSLARELTEFEHQYGMTSDIFFAKYSRGEIEDAMPFVKWAGRYQLYLDLKSKIQTSLDRVIAA